MRDPKSMLTLTEVEGVYVSLRPVHRLLSSLRTAAASTTMDEAWLGLAAEETSVSQSACTLWLLERLLMSRSTSRDTQRPGGEAAAAGSEAPPGGLDSLDALAAGAGEISKRHSSRTSTMS